MKLVCNVLDVIRVSIEDGRFTFEAGWFADGSDTIDRVKESLSLRVGIVGGRITMEVERITVQVTEAIIVVVWIIFEEADSVVLAETKLDCKDVDLVTVCRATRMVCNELEKVCLAIKVGRNPVEVRGIPVEFAETKIEALEIVFEEFDPVEDAETINEVVRPIFEDADVTLIDVFFGVADEDGCKLRTITGPYFKKKERVRWFLPFPCIFNGSQTCCFNKYS